MSAILNGDYSKYPEPIRETFCRIAGEMCEVRQAWSLYHRLFMENPRLTDLMSKHLGPLLGIFQNTLQDEMLLSLARLTDKDNRSQPNLSIWCLQEATPFAKSPDFQKKLQGMLTAISQATEGIRKHRHKRIAHFDRNVSLNTSVLPEVTFAEIRNVIEMLEALLNHLSWEFAHTTILYDMFPGTDITGVAEVTVLKASAYDILERAGTIEHGEWRKHWKA